MAEYQHQPHLDSIETNLIALVDSTSALRRGFTTIASSLAENKLLLQEILNLLPPLTTQDQSHEEPEGLLDSTEIYTIGAIVEAEVFDEMLQPTSEETWMFGDNDDTEFIDNEDKAIASQETLLHELRGGTLICVTSHFSIDGHYRNQIGSPSFEIRGDHGTDYTAQFNGGGAENQLALKHVYCDDSIGEYPPRATLLGFDPGGNYSQARFDMKDVFLHIKLVEQASVDESPALVTQEASTDEVHGSVFKLTFACNYSISWPAISGSLASASMCYKKLQIFEKKGFPLGVVHLLVQAGQANLFTVRIENALKSAIKRPKPTTVKLPFSLCGFQDEHTRWSALGDFEDDPSEQSYKNGIDTSNMKIQVAMPLPTSSFVVSVDDWQTIQSGGEGIAKWLLNSYHLEFIDPVGPRIFKGVYKGRRVGIEKLKGCDKGNAYAFALHRDLLELMTCGHKNILQFYGVCVDENHGLCVVTKLMEGGSVSELIMKNRKLQLKEIVRIATDFAEAIKFVNDHDVAYQDLNTQRILLARHGIACLGDMGIVTACKILGEALEYATAGYRWLAPEIIAGDPTNGYLMSTKDPFIDLMGRLAQKAYMVSSNAGTLLDTYEKLVEFPFMLPVFAKNPKRQTSAIILFGNALSHECWQLTTFFHSQPFDPGISLTTNMLIDSTLSVAFVPTITTDFFLQQILEFNSYEAHNETNLFLGTAIVDLSANGFFVFVAMWPWGILASDYEGLDMGRKIEEPSLWCIVDVAVAFEDTFSLLFMNIEELIDANDPYRFRLLVMAHVARSVCGKRLIDSLVLAREHLASKLLVDSVDPHRVFPLLQPNCLDVVFDLVLEGDQVQMAHMCMKFLAAHYQHEVDGVCVQLQLVRKHAPFMIKQWLIPWDWCYSNDFNLEDKVVLMGMVML